MQLQKVFQVLAAATLAMTFHACTDTSTNEKGKQIVFTTVKGQALYRLDNTAQVFNTETDIAYEVSATLIIPDQIYGDNPTALKDSIMKVAFDTVSADISASMESYFGNTVAETGYQYTAVDSIVRTDRDGITSVSGDILNMTARLLTYRVSRNTYIPGAAHGLTTSSYITYNLETGKTMSLDYIFTAKGLARLPAIIRARAVSLAPAIGPTNIESLPSQGNFYISVDESIVFIYQPYEVASYAQGAIYIPFYPYQLSEFMTPEGLTFFGLNS